MQVEAVEIVKIVAGLGSIGFGTGGGLAFFKPFATEFFSWWLARLKRRAEIEDARELVNERAAVALERVAGHLEHVEDRLDRLDARQDRVEAHLGIPMTASAVPPAPAPVVRRHPTDPGASRAESTIPPVSAPAR